MKKFEDLVRDGTVVIGEELRVEDYREDDPLEPFSNTEPPPEQCAVDIYFPITIAGKECGGIFQHSEDGYGGYEFGFDSKANEDVLDWLVEAAACGAEVEDMWEARNEMCEQANNYFDQHGILDRAAKLQADAINDVGDNVVADSRAAAVVAPQEIVDEDRSHDRERM